MNTDAANTALNRPGADALGDACDVAGRRRLEQVGQHRLLVHEVEDGVADHPVMVFDRP